MALLNIEPQKARVFVSASHFHPSLIFAGKEGAYPSGAFR
jgi:hypothetical protein